MMRSAIAFLVLALGAAAAVACGDDVPAVSDPAGGTPGVTLDGGTRGDGAVPLPGPQPAVCEGLAPGTRIIGELAHAGDPPTPYGGPIAAGTYELTGLDYWGPFDAGTDPEPPNEGASGRSGSGTLVVTKNTLAFVRAFGASDGTLGAAETEGYGYLAEDAGIAMAKVCPDVAVTTQLGYSAVGSSLAIFVDANHRELYRLQE